jgi:hypothetical protein
MIYTIPTMYNQHMYVEIIGFFKERGFNSPNLNIPKLQQ